MLQMTNISITPYNTKLEQDQPPLGPAPNGTKLFLYPTNSPYRNSLGHEASPLNLWERKV